MANKTMLMKNWIAFTAIRCLSYKPLQNLFPNSIELWVLAQFIKKLAVCQKCGICNKSNCVQQMHQSVNKLPAKNVTCSIIIGPTMNVNCSVNQISFSFSVWNCDFSESSISQSLSTSLNFLILANWVGCGAGFVTSLSCHSFL